MAHKILVVDDEPNILRLMEFILAQQGHEMLVAVNGEEALQTIQTHRPDLVLLDIMMPRIDGYEVARLLRADSATANLPIIMLSAKAQEEDIRRGIEIGVTEYITKPFSPEHLVHRVADFLHQAQKFASGIAGLPLTIENVYFVGMPGERWVLVDTGTPGVAGRILQAARTCYGQASHPEAIFWQAMPSRQSILTHSSPC
jgi:DNA-binding response OmpR family regulator